MSQRVFYSVQESPIGRLRLTSDGESLTGIHMMDPGEDPAPTAEHVLDPSRFSDARGQLDAYFAGDLTDFDVPLSPRGTEFQRRVWERLRTIPYGETISYAELARRIGNPRAVRAVGSANGRNPLPIILPCHRVIGADGSLTGYGGGLDRKRILLELERRGAPATQPLGAAGRRRPQAELFS